MAKQVVINKFDGGKAQDLRTFNTDESADSFNFDILSNPHQLIPLRDTVSETTASGAMTDIQISDVGTSVVAGNVYLTAVGYESAVSNRLAFYTSSSGMNGIWNQQAVGTTSYQQGTMVVYKNSAYAVGYNGTTDYTLQKYISAGVVTVVGTTVVTAPTGSSYPVPRPFVHPEDNVLYFCVSNVISSWNGSAYTNYTTILPSGYDVTSLTSYGSYLVITMRPHNAVGNSICYLWGRDGTINTLQGNIDFGDGNLNIIENIGNVLVGVMFPQTYGGYSSVINNKVFIKTYSGGAVNTVKSFNINANSNYGIAKMKKDDTLYFGVCEGGSEVSLWATYKNKSGQWVTTRERYINNGSTASTDTIQSIVAITNIGDYVYVGAFQNTVGFVLRATSASATYVNPSKYRTTINPNMPLADREKEKFLVSVDVAYTGVSGGTTTVKYSVNGSADVTIGSSSVVGENIVQAGAEATGIPFAPGLEYTFQVETTGGNKVKEIRYVYTTNENEI